MRAGQRAGQYSDYFLLDYFLLLRAGQRLDRERGWTEGLSSRGLDRPSVQPPTEGGWTEGRAGLDSLPSQGWTERSVQRLSRGCTRLPSHFVCLQGVHNMSDLLWSEEATKLIKGPPQVRVHVLCAEA